MIRVRSYTYTDNNPLNVVDHTTAPPSTISDCYDNIERSKKFGRITAHVDVFRDDNGELVVDEMPNGISLRNIVDYITLIGLAQEDMDLSDGDPRKLR